MDAQIRQGDLNDDYDVIVLPADNVATLTGECREGGGAGRGFGGFGGGRGDESIPPDYRSGFGQEGVDALDEFVENGGTLVTFAEAGSFAIEEFGLPIRNVVGGLPSTEFWSPGSTLKVTVDNTNPLAYGMPEDALAIVLAQNQVYQVVPSDRNHRIERIVTFVDRDILQSGWLLGEDVIGRKGRHGVGGPRAGGRWCSSASACSIGHRHTGHSSWC